jgi:pSer/pThr/pTyr-binding forkhead associated (FHA) protein
VDDPPASAAFASPAELKQRLAAERSGEPILVYRDRDSRQQIVVLGATEVVTIGRGIECHLQLGWDAKISRVHAELRRVGGEWLLTDVGSRNGTLLNGVRLTAQRRLKSLDQIRIGHTEITFRAPVPPAMTTTHASDVLMTVDLSPAQRRVLIALCRPYGEDSSSSSPATNREIADELFLSVPAVKTHLRGLFQRFGVDDVPQNEKRARLAKLALASGAVSPSDLCR